MRKIILGIMLMIAGTAYVRAQTNFVEFDLTDSRRVIERNINRNLMLRVTKDSSVSRKDFGWLVEVFRRPSRRNSRNLIYTNKVGVTADQSQVMAWQTGSSDFPNRRLIKVSGFPLNVEILLIEPRAEGENINARFLSGKLRISWHRP